MLGHSIALARRRSMTLARPLRRGREQRNVGHRRLRSASRTPRAFAGRRIQAWWTMAHGRRGYCRALRGGGYRQVGESRPHSLWPSWINRALFAFCSAVRIGRFDHGGRQASRADPGRRSRRANRRSVAASANGGRSPRNETLGAMDAETAPPGPIHATEAVTAAIADRRLRSRRPIRQAWRRAPDLSMRRPRPAGTVHREPGDGDRRYFRGLGLRVAKGPDRGQFIIQHALNMPARTRSVNARHCLLQRGRRDEPRVGHQTSPCNPGDADGARRSGSSPRRVSASTATPPTRRCSTRSRGW